MHNGLLLGGIADDYTGGSDMAGMLAEAGVRTIQTFGVPDDGVLQSCREAEAVIVSLKTRSIAAADAVAQSLAALNGLRVMAPRQVQFKYCSTFDSTEAGNIGPVTDALMRALDVPFTIAVPALPVNGRTQYRGYLFVNGVLLSESSLRTHPLNPMTEPNLVRHLQRQTARRVGLIDLHAVRSGRFEPDPDVEIALIDAIDDTDLQSIANGPGGSLPLITGGSGISKALPSAWVDQLAWQPTPWRKPPEGTTDSRTLLLAGSCSSATVAQVQEWCASGGSAVRMRVDRIDDSEIDRLVAFAGSHPSALIYSSAGPGGRSDSPDAIERAFARIATRLAGKYSRLIVAGGETSGAVVEALGISAVAIGKAIDPGVPQLTAIGRDPLRLALKSGNFGAVDFFRKAEAALTGK